MRVFNPLPVSPISIHALTRRAAKKARQAKYRRDISIHALTRRAATNNIINIGLISISIHALTRRAAATYSM